MTLNGSRITIVGMNYSPETTGTAPYTRAMAQTLADEGARVHVITGIPHYPQWRVLDDKYASGRSWREHDGRVSLTRLRHPVPETPDLLGRARMESVFFARAVRALRRDRSDIVIAVTPMLSSLAASRIARAGRPLGVVVQDLTGSGASESGSTGPGVAWVVSQVERSLLRRADAIGVVAARFHGHLAAKGIRADRIMDLPNFAHVAQVQSGKVEARKRLGWPEGALTVVHTGNMGMKQGLEVVVDAARLAEREHVNLQFVLVGDGNQRAELRTRAEGLRNIRFVSPLSAEDYPYALAAADILLLTERRSVREMSMPSKLTSYSASHRPLIASVAREGVTGTFLAERGAALIVDQGDPKELMRGIESLSADPELAAGIAGALSALYAGEYSADAAARRYESFAERLLSVRRSRGGEES